MLRFSKVAVAALLALTLNASTASARSVRVVCPQVPEIDPGSMLGAMTLLGGGLMWLTDRRRDA